MRVARRGIRGRRGLAAAALVFSLVCLTAAARPRQMPPAPPPLATSPAPQQAPPFRIQARVERVAVDVGVTDASGHFVAGLDRQQFHVFDNGTEQPVTNFSPVEAPARVLLLVETSPAVYLLAREHVLAVYRLLQGLAADDYVALATYDDRIHPLLDFTADKAEAAATLGQLQFGLGLARLDLFGSLAAAIERVQEIRDPPSAGKTAIVLLATGLSDVRDAATLERLRTQLMVSGVSVYVVALGGELRSPGHRTAREQEAAAAFAQADRDLTEISASSGGRAYFPRTEQEFAGIYAELAAALRHLYSLAFAPPAHDGRVHELRVEVRDAQGKEVWRVLARPAYLAPQE